MINIFIFGTIQTTDSDKTKTIYGISDVLIKAGNRLVITLLVFFLYSGEAQIKANKGKYCFVRVSGWIIGIRLPFLKLHCYCTNGWFKVTAMPIFKSYNYNIV